MVLKRTYNEDPTEVDRRAALFVWVLVLSGILAILSAIIGPRLAVAGTARDARSGTAARPIPSVEFTWSGEPAAREAQIEKWLRHWFAKCSPRKLHAALEHVPAVVEASHDGDVNPAIVAAIVSLESTWKTDARGRLGEVGLMQVMGSRATSAREQLDDGVAKLQLGWKRCGTTVGAVSYYATGHTCGAVEVAGRRVRMAAEIERWGVVEALAVAVRVD
jgi:hypothetical protein